MSMASERQASDAALGTLALAVEREVRRARGLHPALHSGHEAYAVILEELEEFWEQVKRNPERLSEIERAARLASMREELIQTAAMCLRAVIDLDY